MNRTALVSALFLALLPLAGAAQPAAQPDTADVQLSTDASPPAPCLDVGNDEMNRNDGCSQDGAFATGDASSETPADFLNLPVGSQDDADTTPQN